MNCAHVALQDNEVQTTDSACMEKWRKVEMASLMKLRQIL